jgi:hypothetical protein
MNSLWYNQEGEEKSSALGSELNKVN